MGSIVSKMKKEDDDKTSLLPKKPSLNLNAKKPSKIKNKLKTVKNRLNNFLKKGWTTTSWIIWVTGVSLVVLVTPIAFQYEKECQLFEMQAHFFQAQQAANVPQLN